MTLTLDHNQRLNLVAMLDRMEVQGRREVWAVCDLQKQIDLSDDERASVGYVKGRADDGREYVVWNGAQNGVPPHEYVFGEDDAKRICRAVDGYRVVLARDRMWWEPLVAQLPQPEENDPRRQPA